MTLRYVEGDLFNHIPSPDHSTIIAHVCNDRGAFGSGFVVPLAKSFPFARESYIEWSKGKSFDWINQGLVEFLNGEEFQRGNTQMVTVKPNVIVANMVAQTLGGARPLYYNDLAKCMDQVACTNEIQAGGKIICPMFGSKLAGGDWRFVEKLIEDCWLRQGIDVTVYYLKQFLPDNWKLPENDQ